MKAVLLDNDGVVIDSVKLMDAGASGDGVIAKAFSEFAEFWGSLNEAKETYDRAYPLGIPLRPEVPF